MKWLCLFKTLCRLIFSCLHLSILANCPDMRGQHSLRPSKQRWAENSQLDEWSTKRWKAEKKTRSSWMRSISCSYNRRSSFSCTCALSTKAQTICPKHSKTMQLQQKSWALCASQVESSCWPTVVFWCLKPSGGRSTSGGHVVYTTRQTS